MNERDLTRAKILGVLIRDARLHAGRTAAACAEALGIEAAQIERFEEGTAIPTLPQLEALAVFLQVPLAHFWGDKTLGDYPDTQFVGYVTARQRAIGAAVREAREAQGQSLAEIAVQAGLDGEQLETIESGLAHVTLFELEQIASALGLSLAAFTDEETPILARHEARLKERRLFDELPADMKAFVTMPINRSYLEIAMRLSRMDVNELRSVAENILNITF